jgi:putative acetyltransferase
MTLPTPVTGPEMKLRAFRKEDTEALAVIYKEAALQTGRRAYNEKQVRAWARYPEDMEEFSQALSKGQTLCAEKNALLIAFGQLHPVNHIAYLYVSPAHDGTGVASALYHRLEQTAVQEGVIEITVNASRIARPFFEHKGFTVLGEEHAERHGVVIERFSMQKRLRNPLI